MAIKWVSEQRVLDALREWRKAADRGYGERDHSYSHMQKVDARIRKLKEKYEALVAQKKSQPKSSVLANPRGRSIPCRVIPNGKGGYRVFVTAKEAARLRVGNPRYGKGKNEPRDVFDKHMLRIARQTLKMSDIGARIMGGQTKEEAREIIRRLGGGEAEIRRLEQ